MRPHLAPRETFILPSSFVWVHVFNRFCALCIADVVSKSAVLQVVAWYDNEWGYSQRVVDLAEITAKHWE